MSDTAKNGREWWRWLVVCGVTVGVGVPSLLPNAGVGGGVALWLHALAGAILVSGYAVAVGVRTADSRIGYWVVGGAVVVVVVIEALQAGIPGRSPALLDVVAGWGGVAVAGVGWVVIRW